MADIKVDPKDAEIAALKAQLAGKSDVAELAKAVATAVAQAIRPSSEPKLRKNQPLASEHQGTKTYMVGPSKHYRDGRTYVAGELVTVTNERPAKDWRLVVDGKVVDSGRTPPAVVVVPASGRTSDRSVG